MTDVYRRNQLNAATRLQCVLHANLVKAHRRPWRVKGKKSGSIRKPEQVKTDDGVSVDQIISVPYIFTVTTCHSLGQ